MLLDDNEVRMLMIEILTAPTARDRQTRLGPSDISDGCARCIGLKFLGDKRESPFAARPWLGRVGGNAWHKYFEHRINDGVSWRAVDAGVVPERYVRVAEIPGYGWIGGSIDITLPHQIVDIKGTERKKLLPLLDAIQMILGGKPIYGRSHKDVKLSEKEYGEVIAASTYKMQSYVGQQNLYMYGANENEGNDIRQASIFYICRDGTGYFDNPESDGWADPSRVHDTHVVTFSYDKSMAEGLIARAGAIYQHVLLSGSAEGLQPASECYTCKIEERDLIAMDKLPDVVARFGKES